MPYSLVWGEDGGEGGVDGVGVSSVGAIVLSGIIRIGIPGTRNDPWLARKNKASSVVSSLGILTKGSSVKLSVHGGISVRFMVRCCAGFPS